PDHRPGCTDDYHRVAAEWRPGSSVLANPGGHRRNGRLHLAVDLRHAAGRVNPDGSLGIDQRHTKRAGKRHSADFQGDRFGFACAAKRQRQSHADHHAADAFHHHRFAGYRRGWFTIHADIGGHRRHRLIFLAGGFRHSACRLGLACGYGTDQRHADGRGESRPNRLQGYGFGFTRADGHRDSHYVDRGVELVDYHYFAAGWHRRGSIQCLGDCHRWDRAVYVGRIGSAVRLGNECGRPDCRYSPRAEHQYRHRDRDRFDHSHAVYGSGSVLAHHPTALDHSDHFAAPDDAETFGAAALGLTKDQYYYVLCGLADELEQTVSPVEQ